MSASVMASPIVSLRQLMDEELARKLQQDELPPIEIPQESFHEDELDPDFLLALKLSEEEASKPSEEDSDLILAMKLQEQYEMERDTEVRKYLDSKRDGNSLSKVSIAYNNYMIADDMTYNESHGKKYTADDYEDPDQEEVSDEDVFYDMVYPDQIESRKLQGRIPSSVYSLQQQHQQLQKQKQAEQQQQQQSSKKEIITKHNSEVSGRVNASLLEDNLSAQTGNLSERETLLSNPVFNALSVHAQRTENRRIRYHGKEDRETREGVMDPKTRILLFKMVNSGLLQEIQGIISTGKEANVYRAVGTDVKFLPKEGTKANPIDLEGDSNSSSADVDDGGLSAVPCHYAVKIYKTTLNEFKNRDEYIKGDYRFRFRFNKQNPRKYLRIWAEKERDNLLRLSKAEILCPRVAQLKKHVLVLQMIGDVETGEPALQLREAYRGMSSQRLFDCYHQVIVLMRRMFQRAKLVHADLSEYNLLYHAGQVYVIDVAQSVEHEHPQSLVFLRRDCDNMVQFFRRVSSFPVLSVQELFNYVTDITLNDSTETEALEKLHERVSQRSVTMSEVDKLQEKVFMQSYIPRHLADMVDPALEIELVQKGNREDLMFHQPMTGLTFSGVMGGEQEDEDGDYYDDEDDEDEDSTDSSSEEDGQDGDSTLGTSTGTSVSDLGSSRAGSQLSKQEAKMARKLAKKEFKLAQRERRAQRSASKAQAKLLKKGQLDENNNNNNSNNNPLVEAEEDTEGSVATEVTSSSPSTTTTTESVQQ